MIVVLFGIDFGCFSSCTAARMTFKADEGPVAWKKCFTLMELIGG